MKTAKVIDLPPAMLLRKARAAAPGPQSEAPFIDDLADGIEAIHQLSNAAGFSERPRAFIFALASAAHKAGEQFVELYDDQLAEQQGCSTRTVRRQRADYLRESRAKRFGFVEVIEGDYNKGTNQNAPTRYRFHIGGQIAGAVALARQAEGWAEMNRAQQREAIARACEEIFPTIPDARRQRRKGRRPRLTTAEIKSRVKAAETHLNAANELASNLSDLARAELAEEGSELRERLLKMRAQLDGLLEITGVESVDASEDDRGDRTNCPHPHVSSPSAEPVRVSGDINNTRTLTPPEAEPVEHPPEAVATWGQLEERLTRPMVQTAEIALTAVPPAEDLDAEVLAERAAILEYEGGLDRAEAEARAGEVLRE